MLVNSAKLTMTFFGFIFLSVVLFGCTPLPPAIGVLYNYEKLQESPELLLRYHDQAPQESPPTHLIWFDKLEWLVPQSIDGELREELERVCMKRLRQWILNDLGGNVIVLRNGEDRAVYADYQNIGVMRIRPAITMVKKGNGLLRYLVGFGAGNARVWVEVLASQEPEQFTLPPSIHEVASYGVSNGPRSGLFNFGAFSNRACLRLAVDHACMQVAQHLASQIKQPETEWWKFHGDQSKSINALMTPSR